MALLGVGFQEGLKLLESSASVGDLVLLLKIHLGKSLSVTLGLEDGVPTKHILASGSHDLSFTFANEEDRLSFCVLTVSIDAHGVSSLVFKSSKEIVKTLSPKLVKEALAVDFRK